MTTEPTVTDSQEASAEVGIDVQRLVLRCDSCRYQKWNSATMSDPYPHVWCAKGHWEGAEPSGITEDPWTDCADFLSQND